jgi:hypothetical protein
MGFISKMIEGIKREIFGQPKPEEPKKLTAVSSKQLKRILRR